MKTVIGKRIRQARKAAGLSMRELAKKAGISAMAISKYENSQSTPSSGSLAALATVLNLRIEYFFRRVSVDLSNVRHRKHHLLPRKEERKVLADATDQLERWLALEEFLPAPWSVAFSLPDDLTGPITTYDAIEDAAVKVRRHWNLGLNPIPDLIDTLEGKGIKVLATQCDGHQKFNGLSAQVNGAPVIVIGKTWPGDRQRFTLAHELGHLVLHGLLGDELDEEKACDRFAGSFIVPAEPAKRRLGERRTRIEPKELFLLKHEWGLSMQAWLFRTKDLGIMKKAACDRLRRCILRCRQTTGKEPGKPYARERANLFEQMVLHVLAEDMISESKAAELMGMSTIDFLDYRKVVHQSDATGQ